MAAVASGEHVSHVAILCAWSLSGIGRISTQGLHVEVSSEWVAWLSAQVATHEANAPAGGVAALTLMMVAPVVMIIVTISFILITQVRLQFDWLSTLWALVA